MSELELTRSHDMTYVEDRLRALTYFRFGIIAFIGICAASFPSLIPDFETYAFLVGGYLVFALAVEFLRGKVNLTDFGLIVDALFVALLITRTGGFNSRMSLLVYIHVLGITLLLSYRTGLKNASCHSLIQLTFFYAAKAGFAVWLIDPHGVYKSVSTSMVSYRVLAISTVAVATALLSSVNERELRRRKNEFANLAEFEAGLQDQLTPSSVASYVAQSVLHQGFNRTAVAILVEDLNFLVVDSDGNETLIKNWDGATTLLEQQGEPTLSKNNLWQKDAIVDASLPFGTNVMVTPFGVRDCRAWLLAEWPEPSIADSVIRSVRFKCSVASLAIRNADLLIDIERMARTDPLTGLANRQVFDSEFDRMIAHAKRSNEPMSLVILDIDHFKNLNDTYGHQFGDEVLRRAAKGLQEASRETDIVVRYGGEEFAVLCPDCDSESSFALAERFRKALSKYTESPIVTASSGVATYPVNATSVRDLIERADDALYISKDNGRNQTTKSNVTELVNS